jgi:hypothetical protein
MMPKEQFFDIYSGQTTDELISLEREFRTDSIVLAFEQALDQKAYKTGTSNLSNAEIVVLAIESLEREVNNGGYDQYFTNSSKEYVSVIIDSLRKIGSEEAVKITQEAIDTLKMKGGITEEKIDAIMNEENDERAGRLGKCDVQYYQQVGDLSEKLFAFICANREKIVLT